MALTGRWDVEALVTARCCIINREGWGIESGVCVCVWCLQGLEFAVFRRFTAFYCSTALCCTFHGSHDNKEEENEEEEKCCG